MPFPTRLLTTTTGLSIPVHACPHIGTVVPSLGQVPTVYPVRTALNFFIDVGYCRVWMMWGRDLKWLSVLNIVLLSVRSWRLRNWRTTRERRERPVEILSSCYRRRRGNLSVMFEVWQVLHVARDFHLSLERLKFQGLPLHMSKEDDMWKAIIEEAERLDRSWGRNMFEGIDFDGIGEGNIRLSLGLD